MGVGRLTTVHTATGARRTSALLVAALVALVVLVVLVAPACTGARPHLSSKKEVTTTGATPTSAARAREVAQATGESIDLYSDASSAKPTSTLTTAEATSAPSVPIVFLVKQRTGDRLEVYLPVEPAGSSGWVRRSDVKVSSVPYRIELDLANHSITVFDLDKIVLDEPIGVGPDRPTAGGIYYLKELLQPPTQNGPYGSYAYGLSGFSTDLATFNGGKGLVGIHGTTSTSSLGRDASSGSIRVANDVIQRLVTDVGLPLGTPVEILG